MPPLATDFVHTEFQDLLRDWIASNLDGDYQRYAEWAASQGITGTQSDDDDNDGLSNGLEYLTNGQGISLTLNGNAIEFVQPANRGVRIEGSTDLLNWFDLPDLSNKLFFPAANTLRTDLTVPSDQSRYFIRARISQP